MARKHRDLLVLESAESIDNDDTVFDLVDASGLGTIGSDYIPITFDDGLGVIETMHVTARSTNTITVLRAQEGTTGVSWSTGSIAECRLTSAAIDGKLDIASAPPSVISSIGTDNIVIGTNAGQDLASGADQNILIGKLAGGDTTTGDGQIAIGENALRLYTTTNSRSVAIGNGALAALTTGTNWIAIGQDAAGSVTSSQGVAIGRNAGGSAGNNSVFIGYNAGVSKTGTDCIGIGQGSMGSGTAGRTFCIAIGGSAHEFGTGNHCVAIGNTDGTGATGRQNGNYCVAIGASANANSSGTDETCIGNQSGANGSTASRSYNSMFGSNTGCSGASGGAAVGASGHGNVFIGYRATGSNVATANSIAIGRDAVSTIASGATSSDNGPGIAIGSAAYPVGFRGDGTIYSAVGASAGYWRVKINGTQYKIQLFADS